MTEHYCSIHKIAFGKHEKNGKVWYSHFISDDEGWCNEAKKPQETREPVSSGDSKDWLNFKAHEKDSMMRMAAQKNAAQVVAAYLSRPDVECPKNITDLIIEVSNKLLTWLKSSSGSQTASDPRSEESKPEEDLF